MSLFPHDDTVTQGIAAWDGYRDTLSAKRREKFNQMMSRLYKDIEAINSKPEPHPNDAIFMSLMIEMREMVDGLIPEFDKVVAINRALQKERDELLKIKQILESRIAELEAGG